MNGRKSKFFTPACMVAILAMMSTLLVEMTGRAHPLSTFTQEIQRASTSFCFVNKNLLNENTFTIVKVSACTLEKVIEMSPR